MTLLLELEEACENIPDVLEHLEVELNKIAIQVHLLYPRKNSLWHRLSAFLLLGLVREELYIDNHGHAVSLHAF